MCPMGIIKYILQNLKKFLWIKAKIEATFVKNEGYMHSQDDVWIYLKWKKKLQVDQRKDGETNTHANGHEPEIDINEGVQLQRPNSGFIHNTPSAVQYTS
jgi:hypothetical protein